MYIVENDKDNIVKIEKSEYRTDLLSFFILTFVFSIEYMS